MNQTVKILYVFDKNSQKKNYKRKFFLSLTALSCSLKHAGQNKTNGKEKGGGICHFLWERESTF